MKLVLRVDNIDPNKGLWYNKNGNYTGEYNEYLNREIDMSFDETLVDTISVVRNLDELFIWFCFEDLLKLRKIGYVIKAYLVRDENLKYHEKYKHYYITNEKLLIEINDDVNIFISGIKNLYS